MDITSKSELVLAGGGVVAGDDLELLDPGYVVVRDGRITQVGAGEPPAGIPVVDLRGHLVVPGFINCHTHVGDSAFKELGFGLPATVNLLWQPDGLRFQKMAQTPRAELVAAMRRSVRQMISAGTVAFADFREGGAAGVADLREACRDLPIRCLIYARHAKNPLHTAAEFTENRAGLSEDDIDSIVTMLAEADGFSPVWANENTDVSLQQTAQLVRRIGKRLATHACETDGYRNLSLSRTGTPDVTRVVQLVAPDFVVHMTAATDDELDQVIDADIPIVMCPRTQAALGNGVPPFHLAAERGARLALGTDNVMISSPDLLTEMDFLGRALRVITRDPAVLTARQILSSTTIDAARVLQLDDELGSITAGKSASLVVFDLDSLNLGATVDPIASLVQRASANDIRAVLIDGVIAHGSLGGRTT